LCAYTEIDESSPLCYAETILDLGWACVFLQEKPSQRVPHIFGSYLYHHVVECYRLEMNKTEEEKNADFYARIVLEKARSAVRG
jgi:hypothetical protein